MMNGNTVSPACGLRDELERAQEALEQVPRCSGHGESCGELCWVQDALRVSPDDLAIYGPCAGAVHAGEEYPDVWIHYCDAHGLPEEFWENKEEQRRMAAIEASLGKMTT